MTFRTDVGSRLAVGASPGSSPALSGSVIALSGFVVMAMEMLGKGVFSKLCRAVTNDENPVLDLSTCLAPTPIFGADPARVVAGTMR